MAISLAQSHAPECSLPRPPRPAPPETPKLLPAVALMWPPLLGALHDARTALVERGLRLVADVTRVGGGTFMARRWVWRGCGTKAEGGVVDLGKGVPCI